MAARQAAAGDEIDPNITITDRLAASLNPKQAARRCIDALFPNSRSVTASMSKPKMSVRDGVATGIYNGREVRFKRADGFDPQVSFDGIFVDEPYARLRVSGSRVLDIGAGTGDSSIYFALRGALKVVAYDTDPAAIAIMRSNIALNGLGSIISPVMREATSESIDEFAEEFAGGGKALKIDCEGCEYRMLLGAKRLREFGSIILEYHYGYLDIEKHLLLSGFTVSHSRPHSFGGMMSGILYAEARMR